MQNRDASVKSTQLVESPQIGYWTVFVLYIELVVVDDFSVRLVSLVQKCSLVDAVMSRVSTTVRTQSDEAEECF